MHHVGIVVENLADAAESTGRILGLRAATPIYEDPIQRVRVQFWESADHATCVELIEPLGDDSPSAGALRKGGGLNHICYEVEDVEAAFAKVTASGAAAVTRPVPAVAFGGRRIAFVFVRSVGLVEFLEAEKK